jgi:putative flippase GtrA
VVQRIRSYKNAVIRGLDWLHRPFHRWIPSETFRYAATGGLNTLLDIVLYFICYNFILVKKPIVLPGIEISAHIGAFLIVFPITFLTGFLLARYITFTASPIRGRIQIIRYGLTVSGAILLNYILLKFFVEALYFWPTIAKAFTTVIVIGYSYLAQRFFTFKTGAIPIRSTLRD